ncbi:putative UDP-N-acetylglucosamine diphosphorylase 1 [Iris pallida]|uniref:UDP-N-acetylglucosamine diphosphorylase 1 n=1 Tax=Iris pallida TaxID=29817 RepID=A0AAX6DUF2_IRIPA|nr:putative UDP-N-acetylglucosamine diphosphorylase 1 [Iris pallida]KAJ6837808.1 putative UDP-N-acetylglucosamine diphosphorylase 1 [Iris pallida]
MEMMKDYGQEDGFTLWEELSVDECNLLVKDIQGLDLLRIDQIIRCSLGSQGSPVLAIELVPEASVSTVEDRIPEARE